MVEAFSSGSSSPGNENIELFNGTNSLKPISAMPGASEVKTVRLTTGATSTTVSTELTPTSGKKVRVISLDLISDSATATNFEVYFGTGANITSNAGKEIAETRLDTDIVLSFTKTWPDGGGPVGAVDEVVSVRTSADIGTGGFGILTYREE